MKLFFLLIVSVYAVFGTAKPNAINNNYGCIDSIWGDFNLDTARFSDTTDKCIIDYINFKVDIDTSKWLLYKIDKDFHYYRIFSYSCETDVVKVTGELPPIKSATFAMALMGGWNCAVAHMEQEECIAHCLLDSSRITDTIPHVMNMVTTNDTAYINWKEYWVGWRRIRVGEKTYEPIKKRR